MPNITSKNLFTLFSTLILFLGFFSSHPAHAVCTNSTIRSSCTSGEINFQIQPPSSNNQRFDLTVNYNNPSKNTIVGYELYFEYDKNIAQLGIKPGSTNNRVTGYGFVFTNPPFIGLDNYGNLFETKTIPSTTPGKEILKVVGSVNSGQLGSSQSQISLGRLIYWLLNSGNFNIKLINNSQFKSKLITKSATANVIPVTGNCETAFNICLAGTTPTPTPIVPSCQSLIISKSSLSLGQSVNIIANFSSYGLLRYGLCPAGKPNCRVVETSNPTTLVEGKPIISTKFTPTSAGVYVFELGSYDSSSCNQLCSAGSILYRNDDTKTGCLSSKWTQIGSCQSRGCLKYLTAIAPVAVSTLTPTPTPRPTSIPTPRPTSTPTPRPTSTITPTGFIHCDASCVSGNDVCAWRDASGTCHVGSAPGIGWCCYRAPVGCQCKTFFRNNGSTPTDTCEYNVPVCAPTPTPDPCASMIPKNLKCDYQNNKITWDFVPGASHYPLRVDADPWSFGCQPANPGDVCEDVISTSKNYTFQPGKTYVIWVHSISQQCGWSQAAYVSCKPPLP